MDSLRCLDINSSTVNFGEETGIPGYGTIRIPDASPAGMLHTDARHASALRLVQ